MIIHTDQGIKNQVYKETKRLPVHCYSKVPFKYKKYAITGELHRVKTLASDFDEEMKKIRDKHPGAG